MTQMTPAKIREMLQAFNKMVGPECENYLHIPDGRYASKPISFAVYAEGVTNGATFRIEADDWEEAFALAYTKWDEVKERSAAGKIERMALEIIRVTAIKGECRGADLRTAKFSQADIDLYSTFACNKADAMANNGPFSITPEAKANAA